MRAVFRYIRRNPSLALGIVLLAMLALFVLIGNLIVDTEAGKPHVVDQWTISEKIPLDYLVSK